MAEHLYDKREHQALHAPEVYSGDLPQVYNHDASTWPEISSGGSTLRSDGGYTLKTDGSILQTPAQGISVMKYPLQSPYSASASDYSTWRSDYSTWRSEDGTMQKTPVEGISVQRDYSNPHWNSAASTLLPSRTSTEKEPVYCTDPESIPPVPQLPNRSQDKQAIPAAEPTTQQKPGRSRRKKWSIIGGIVFILIAAVIGGAVGGVLSQRSKSSSDDPVPVSGPVLDDHLTMKQNTGIAAANCINDVRWVFVQDDTNTIRFVNSPGNGTWGSGPIDAVDAQDPMPSTPMAASCIYVTEELRPQYEYLGLVNNYFIQLIYLDSASNLRQTIGVPGGWQTIDFPKPLADPNLAPAEDTALSISTEYMPFSNTSGFNTSLASVAIYTSKNSSIVMLDLLSQEPPKNLFNSFVGSSNAGPTSTSGLSCIYNYQIGKSDSQPSPFDLYTTCVYPGHQLISAYNYTSLQNATYGTLGSPFSNASNSTDWDYVSEPPSPARASSLQLLLLRSTDPGFPLFLLMRVTASGQIAAVQGTLPGTSWTPSVTFQEDRSVASGGRIAAANRAATAYVYYPIMGPDRTCIRELTYDAKGMAFTGQTQFGIGGCAGDPAPGKGGGVNVGDEKTKRKRGWGRPRNAR